MRKDIKLEEKNTNQASIHYVIAKVSCSNESVISLDLIDMLRNGSL